jgi:diadenylate cyclase
LAIVTFIIGGIYYSLKNTIAIKILFGLVILILLSFITEAVDLRSFNWLISTVRDIWLIGFIVLFQPEIRRALVMLTKSPIFQLFVRSKITETLEETVEAIVELSGKHTGALIVMPKSQNIQMTLDTGIPLQALVSKELILSIFNVKSPLHDGAVIIDNEQVLAARCILPLSLTSKINGHNLGTRHRAAIGLTEQSDAIVIVVSEETGWVSIANEGELHLNLDKNELNEKILNFLKK